MKNWWFTARRKQEGRKTQGRQREQYSCKNCKNNSGNKATLQLDAEYLTEEDIIAKEIYPIFSLNGCSEIMDE